MRLNIWLTFLTSITVFVVVAGSALYAEKKNYPTTAVPFTSVKMIDHCWLPRISTNHEETIPTSFERWERTGRIKNFEIAAAKIDKFCTIFHFEDTDIYKTIEAVKADDANNSITTVTQPFVAIPYYAWAHRGKGEMVIWLPQKITGIEILSKNQKQK